MQIVIGPGFSGTRPVTAPGALEVSEAQVAENCKLWSGELRPWAGWTQVEGISTPGTTLTVWKYRDEWLSWNTDVDCVRSLLAEDDLDILMYTGDGSPKYRTKNGDVFPLGLPVPTTAPATVRSGSGTENPQQVSHVYTYVNTQGWEGANSAPSTVVEICDGDTAEVTGMIMPPTGYGITKMRVYRLISGSSGTAEYEFVAEIDPATSYSDTMAATSGDTLQTETYLPPPETLKGLTALPGSILAGFAGRSVRFSEPTIPYAYPDAHSYMVPFDIVGLGVVGTSIVVLTKGPVYVMSGSAPESMSVVRLPGNVPCLSERSIVSTEAGVLFAGPDGLYLCNGQTAALLTGSIFSEAEWGGLNPATITAAAVDGRYLFFSTSSGATTGHAIDFRHQASGHTTIALPCSGLYMDDADNSLYLIVKSGGTQYIAGWEQSGDIFRTLYFRWRSKRFTISPNINLSAAQVVAAYAEAAQLVLVTDELKAENQAIIDAGGLMGALNEVMFNETVLNGDTLRDLTTMLGPGIMFRLYVDGRLVFSQTIRDNRPFRLPTGFVGREFEFQIEGNFPVTQVRLGTSITEMIA